MDNQKKLELTLCGMLPYGLEVKLKTDNQNYRLKGVEYGRDEIYLMVLSSICVEANIKDFKPLLHSLDKLINNILDDDNDYFYQLNYDLCEILETTDCEYFVKSLIGDAKYVISTHKMIEALEFLKQNHFNIYNLPKEMYTEKSESNGK